VPVSRSHGFAFVHVPKSAGTSILTALSEPMQGEVLDFGGRGIIDLLCAHPRRRWILTTINGFNTLGGLVDFPLQHLPAIVLRELIGRRLWEKLFTFSFVRNPWDLVVSAYHFQMRNMSEPAFLRFEADRAAVLSRCTSFTHFVRIYPIIDPRDQYDLIADERGDVIVDFVGRYESLQSDFAAICQRLGFGDVSVPHLNASSHRPYREYYTEETKALVGRFFARSIERFGYEF
jgi:Sulfotransferase family